MSIIHQAPGVFDAGGPPNEDGLLKMSDGTYLAQRVFQVGFAVNIEVIFTRDGQLRIQPSHTDPAFLPADEWYQPGFTPDIGFAYECRLVSTSQPFFVEAAPVGVWIGLEGDVLERRRWMFFRNTEGTSNTVAVFEVRTETTHVDLVQGVLNLSLIFT